MNKYQETFEYVIGLLSDVFDYDLIAMNPERYALLKELVDKATPKKITLYFDGIPKTYECPACKTRNMGYGHYCPYCGQSLDRRMRNESNHKGGRTNE